MSENNGMNRAKFYQLALFPMNNGATNVYFVLSIPYLVQPIHFTEVKNKGAYYLPRVPRGNGKIKNKTLVS